MLLKTVIISVTSLCVVACSGETEEPSTESPITVIETPESTPIVEPTPTPTVEPIPTLSPISESTPEPTATPIASSGQADPLSNPTASLDERLEIIEVQLPVYVGQGSITKAIVTPSARAGGGVFLGWNSDDEGHVTRLNEDMESDGDDWLLPGDLVVEIEGLDDGGAAVLVTNHTVSLNDSFNYDRPLRLIRFDAMGNQLWVTTLTGGNGIGAGEQWYAWSGSRSANIVAEGDRLLVYAMMSEHKPIAGTHQGDLYVEVNVNSGAEYTDIRDWFLVSHSNNLHLLTSETGEGLTLTVGDAGPFGLEYNNQNTKYVQNIWPPEEQRDIGRANTSSVIDAGDLCGFNREGGTLYATVATTREQPFSYREDNGDIVLLSWPVEGGEVQQTWLTNTPTEQDRCPTLTPFASDHRLSVWESSEGTASMALLDLIGNVVKEAVVVNAPYHRYSPVTALTNGTVLWAFADHGDTSVRLVLVKP